MMDKNNGSDQTVKYKNISARALLVSVEAICWTDTDFFSCLCGQTAFMDLVDVFAVPAAQPSSDHQWNNTPHQAAARMRGMDPWDSLGKSWVS